MYQKNLRFTQNLDNIGYSLMLYQLVDISFFYFFGEHFKYHTMCTKRNMYGREYQQCIGLSTDFRSLLIQDLIDRGCDSAGGKVPWGALSATAKKFKVSVKTVNKIWRRFVEHGTCTEKMRNKSGPRKLTEPDQ